MSDEIRTVADLARAGNVTDLEDLRLLHSLAKRGPIGPAKLWSEFCLYKRHAELASPWTLPDNPIAIEE